MRETRAWCVAALWLALAGPAAAQQPAPKPHLLLRGLAGFLNQDDPLDWEFAAAGEAAVDFRDRLAVVLRVVRQGRVDNPGRAGPIPQYRVVIAGGLEYAPAARSPFGEQFRVRISGGGMARQGVAAAPVVAPGFLIRYRIHATPLAMVLAMEDMVTFLPTEVFPPSTTVDAKVEHNFLAMLGLELRL